MAKIPLEKSAGLDKFVKEIKDQLGDKILGLYLFGMMLNYFQGFSAPILTRSIDYSYS